AGPNYAGGVGCPPSGRCARTPSPTGQTSPLRHRPDSPAHYHSEAVPPPRAPPLPGGRERHRPPGRKCPAAASQPLPPGPERGGVRGWPLSRDRAGATPATSQGRAELGPRPLPASGWRRGLVAVPSVPGPSCAARALPPAPQSFPNRMGEKMFDIRAWAEYIVEWAAKDPYGFLTTVILALTPLFVISAALSWKLAKMIEAREREQKKKQKRQENIAKAKRTKKD
uniref:Small integral membrane protein 15 n=3 Tax=Archosauria TaxID=8492 RepID=A0A7M4FHX6_CROPO